MTPFRRDTVNGVTHAFRGTRSLCRKAVAAAPREVLEGKWVARAGDCPDCVREYNRRLPKGPKEEAPGLFEGGET